VSVDEYLIETCAADRVNDGTVKVVAVEDPYVTDLAASAPPDVTYQIYAVLAVGPAVTVAYRYVPALANNTVPPDNLFPEVSSHW
jgi:hypothetical protein